MALVLIDTASLDTAVAIREAVLADDHEILMIESAGEMESTPADVPIALFITGDPERSEAVKMRSFLGSRIPRPPIFALEIPDSDACGRLRDDLEIDACLPEVPTAEEVQVALTQELERFELQMETGIIGRSEAVRQVLEKIHMIAPVGSTVLLTGESGTGKELVARGIHRLSPRRSKSFIALNCGALPESLLESELFGHEKGAFTGATSLRRGMFELADGGTLLLDEIVEMPLATQTRLLRVLESRRFMRVGGDTEIEVDVRVVAATNRDLQDAVQGGFFRRDLFYRLDVLQIALPPLRERAEDIPVLVHRFIDELSRGHDSEFKGIAPETMEILMRYSWPGNIRELRNLIESMVVLAPGSVIRPEDIPEEIRTGSGKTLLPVQAGGAVVPSTTDPAALPQMEFVFRTLVELKMDVDDLRQEFERYRERHPELLEAPAVVEPGEITVPPLDAAGIDVGAREGFEGPVVHVAGGPEETGHGGVPPTIEFYAGMTMAELEREAIIATLRDSGGNRRKAAAKLQIGERTLYRKLKEYDIDV